MSGSHSPAATISSKQLWVATTITFIFCLGEAAVGYFSNSLALMADAGHNFADALALALSAFAIWMATKPADSKRTFGYHRVGILAALVNAVGLVLMAGAIFWEAVQRLNAPEAVQSGPMMLGDAAASFGVVIAGIVIALTGAYIADPIVSIIFAILVLWSSWNILTESVHVLLEATPAGLDLATVEGAICGVEGVRGVHDLHVWTVSSGLIASSCHILVTDQRVSHSQHIHQTVSQLLAHDFKISHSTIQVEVEDCGGHEHSAHGEQEHLHGHVH